MNFRAATLSSMAVLVACVATVQGANTSRQQADTFARKVVAINDHGALPSRPARRTTITETELNSWFAYRAQPLLPEGLTQPKVTIIGNGKLLGIATIDLDAIGKRRATGGTFDLWSYLGGRVPISVTGVLHTRDGTGRFELQAAEISGVPLPRTLLQELVSYYTRTAEHPQGVRIDDPFELPASIRQIEVGQGQAVVVQ